MKISRDNRPTEAAAAATGPSRRRVLGGLASIPVLYGIASATPALAATATAPKPGGADGATKSRAANRGELVRGAERRYNAPLLTPGTRVVLPAGIATRAIQDYYHRPNLAATASAWPRMTAADATIVDASVLPERGGPTRVALLSGFTEGWYEVIHASGRADRVSWDASKFPFLWFYGEFGATNEAPYHDRFYTLALQPFSRNPYIPASAAN